MVAWWIRYPTGESPAGGSHARVTPVAVIASRRRFWGGLSAVVVGRGVNTPGVGTSGVPVAAAAPTPAGPWGVVTADAAAVTGPLTTTARLAFCQPQLPCACTQSTCCPGGAVEV